MSSTIPLSEVTSEIISPLKLEEYPEVSRTAASTTASLSTTPASTTSTSTEIITVISVEPPEKASSINPKTDIGSTTDSMKLVENSATEILLTTLPAVSSSSSQATTTTTLPSRSTIAVVSQPRPFGFTRRRSGSLEATTTVTTPLSRSKVSITSRNPTRPSSSVLGRVRLRTRPISRVTEEKSVDQVNTPHAGISTSGSKELNISRNRGSSRYTPPTSRARTQDLSTNSAPSPRYREKGRTTTIGTNDGLRRRYRRPSRINSTVESIKVNELDDSPIVRITQDSFRRNPFRLRSDSSDEENDKITNIRILRKPIVNHELYDRTKYTRKRNNEEESGQKLNGELGVEQLTATVDSVIESNPFQPIVVKPIEQNGVTVSINKVDYTSDRPEDVVATTTAHIEAYEFNPDLVTIVSTERTVDVKKISEAPRKRKVLLRRRPILSSTTANIIETEEEKEPHRQITIKRKRPFQDISSTSEVSLEKEKGSSLLLETTISMRSDKSEKSTASINQTGITLTSKNIEESTIVTGLTGFTREMGDSTLTITETTLSTDYNADGFTKVTLETPVTETTTISDEKATDVLSPIMSTINTDSDESRQSTIEIGTEATTMESMLATATVYNTENMFQEDTSIPSTEDLSTTHVQIITTLPTSGTIRAQETITPFTIKSDSLSTTKSSSESRYARKKFIRKSPISSSGNTTNRYSFASSENGSFEVLSRRRNSLFIRRNPVSSSTANTLRDDLIYQEEKEEKKEENAEGEFRNLTRQNVEDTTSKSKSDSTNFSDDFIEFWKYYTTISSRGHPSIPVEDMENRKVARTENAKDDTYRLTSIVTRGPEIRSRYKVPVILKRPFDPEEALSPRRYSPLDSTSEESEETPEMRDERLRQASLRQPRTRYKLRDGDNIQIDEETTLPSTESMTWQYNFRTRSYPKRPSSTSTEAAITETLIPAKKFDYIADAFYRKQQSLRTTTPRGNDFLDSQNLIVPYHMRTTTKPSVTRLVTSVTESGTTERQKILIKTKYSSLTATRRIPADQFSPTTPLSVLVTGVDDESVNEIRQGVERSTLPIEGEFNYRYDGRFTTESHESSTIEIESVFNNLIGGKGFAK